MTDVIDFLERLGQDAELRREPLERALKGAVLNSAVCEALESRDQSALATLLGSRNVCCMINVPMQEDQEIPSPQKTRAA